MIDEYTGKKIVSPLDLPEPKPFAPTTEHEERILCAVKSLTNFASEPYADLIDIIFGEKFTLQHAILLLAVLRRMDCCDLEPLELSCL